MTRILAIKFCCPICGQNIYATGKDPDYVIPAPPPPVPVRMDPDPMGVPPITASAAEIAVYKRLSDQYYGMKIEDHHVAEAEQIRARTARNRPSYDQASAAFSGNIPWWVFVVCQELEASGDLTKHMHNGDPLVRATRNVPAGRPIGWMDRPAAERTWLNSAIDAAKFDGLDREGKYIDTARFGGFRGLHCSRWSDDVGEALDAFERFNGLGYRNRGVVSPYLFSYTTLYVRGKYRVDGVYDPGLVSQQPGAAFIMKALGVY